MTDLEFFWDWVKHEDHIFTNRGSFFLIGESMLLAGYASLLSEQSLNLEFALKPFLLTGRIQAASAPHSLSKISAGVL